MSTHPPFGKMLLVTVAVVALITQAVLAWTQGGDHAPGRIRQLASALFVAGTLGRPVPDAYDSFVAWAVRNTAPQSVILLLQPAGNSDAFRYFRTSALAYPRTVWWGDANDPGAYPDWHIAVPAAPQPLASILAHYRIDYLLADGVPVAASSLPNTARSICFNRQLAECLVDVRSGPA